MKRTRLRRISERRLRETELYRYRVRQFLLAHPYCQVWLAEHGVVEAEAIRVGGTITLADCSVVLVPLATEVHHRNKRRGDDLLDARFWLAVSREAHRQIEERKQAARAAGYLLNF